MKNIFKTLKRDLKLLFTQPSKIQEININYKQAMALIIAISALDILCNSTIRNFIVSNYLPQIKLVRAYERDTNYLVMSLFFAPLLEEYTFRNSLRYNKNQILAFLMMIFLVLIDFAQIFNWNDSIKVLTIIFTFICFVYAPTIVVQIMAIFEKIGERGIKILGLGKYLLLSENYKPQPTEAQLRRRENKYIIFLNNSFISIETLYFQKISKIDEFINKQMVKNSLIVLLISVFGFALGHYKNFKFDSPVNQTISVLTYFVPFAFIYSYVAIKFKNGIYYTIILHFLWNLYASRDMLLTYIPFIK
jgi:Type II CAAX prenyl endopeptidase Rce1-like